MNLLSNRALWLLYEGKVNPRIDLLFAFHRPVDPLFWSCGDETEIDPDQDERLDGPMARGMRSFTGGKL